MYNILSDFFIVILKLTVHNSKNKINWTQNGIICSWVPLIIISNTWLKYGDNQKLVFFYEMYIIIKLFTKINQILIILTNITVIKKMLNKIT